MAGRGDGWNGEGCGWASITRGDGSGFLRRLWPQSLIWTKGPFDDPAAIRKFSDDPAAVKDDSQPRPGLLSDRFLSARQSDLRRRLRLLERRSAHDRRGADRPVAVGHGQERQGGQGKRRPLRGGRVPRRDRAERHPAIPGRRRRRPEGRRRGLDDRQLQVQAVEGHGHGPQGRPAGSSWALACGTAPAGRPSATSTSRRGPARRKRRSSGCCRSTRASSPGRRAT